MARIELATWPTPMEPAPRLAAAIGLHPDDLWIKRDDLTGLGAGGNKIRKLEWTLGAALADGADIVITTGAPQSNHARLTAAAAARVGIDSVLVFPGPPPSEARGNLLLDALLGSDIVWADTPTSGETSTDAHLEHTAQVTADELRASGRRPVVIPFGGSNATGAQGYLVAANEITLQQPDLAHLVCAVGSGGTMAGLVAGLGPECVHGVDTGATTNARDRITQILDDMGAATDPTRLKINPDHIGDGYTALTPQTAHALTLAARTEGLILDPTYSGRALAGLIDHINRGDIHPGQRTIFLASGGLPGLFGHPDATSLTHTLRTSRTQ